MFKRKKKSAAPDYFEGMPLANLGVRAPGVKLAVHIRGKLDGKCAPIVCLPGYYRNMKDFDAFSKLFQSAHGDAWPIILIDFQGRGRSTWRKSAQEYSAVADAGDVCDVLNALGVEAAIFVCEGHGAHVLMALSVSHRRLIVGAAMIDAGPLTDSLGLVRARDNFLRLASIKGAPDFERVCKEVWSRSFPGATDQDIKTIAARTHFLAKNRVQSRFDPALLDRLSTVTLEDKFEAQWQFFDTLVDLPLLLVRTQLSDQISRETFNRMSEYRPDAFQLLIPGQGSPALLAAQDEVRALHEFAQYCDGNLPRQPIVSG